MLKGVGMTVPKIRVCMLYNYALILCVATALVSLYLGLSSVHSSTF